MLFQRDERYLRSPRDFICAETPCPPFGAPHRVRHVRGHCILQVPHPLCLSYYGHSSTYSTASGSTLEETTTASGDSTTRKRHVRFRALVGPSHPLCLPAMTASDFSKGACFEAGGSRMPNACMRSHRMRLCLRLFAVVATLRTFSVPSSQYISR